MIKIRFKKEWIPELNDWNSDFDPTQYEWVVEDGRYHNSDKFVDLIALNAPHGEWFRCNRDKITLSDIINLYDSDLSIKNEHYEYNEDGVWTFNDDTDNQKIFQKSINY